MELATAVFIWTASVSLAITTIMLGGYINAKSDLARARTKSEERLHL